MQRSSRMQRELSILTKEPPPGISCWAVDHQIDKLQAEILGSKDTPYTGGCFRLEIQIPERNKENLLDNQWLHYILMTFTFDPRLILYPFQPPKVRFVTKIYHPNIDGSGRICLDTLQMPPKGAWKPAWNISTVLTSIQLLMAEPNPDDPLVSEISDEYKYNRPQFIKNAKEWTQKYATGQKVTAASVKDSLNQANKEAEKNSDSESDTSDESENENKPHTHPTQGVKRASAAQLPGKTKALRPNNY